MEFALKCARIGPRDVSQSALEDDRYNPQETNGERENETSLTSFSASPLQSVLSDPHSYIGTTSK